MPTYNSLGVSASLVVTDLDKTLSNTIQLRMGSHQQKDAERIKSQLDKGRTLPERQVSFYNSKVGILQFVGDDGDMALLSVKAGDKFQKGQGIKRHQNYIDGESLSATDIGAGAMMQRTPSPRTDLQASAIADIEEILGSIEQAAPSTPHSQVKHQDKGRQRVSSNIRGLARNGSGNQDGKDVVMREPEIGNGNSSVASDSNGLPQHSKLSEPGLTTRSGGQYALVVNLNCEKMIKRKDLKTLNGKDLKLELFLNGELVEVTYESMRSSGGANGKRNGSFRFSGKRFHRQGEKPLVYAPASDTSDVSKTGDERWANINKALQQEAIDRGMNKSKQRPSSAAFLVALTHLYQPEGINTEEYAVIDLIITAGSGSKYGPQSQYISEPTRLADRTFRGPAPIVENLGPYRGQDGVITSAYEDPDIIDYQPDPDSLFNDMAGTEPEQQADPPSPHTPNLVYKRRSQAYHDVLEATPIRKQMSAYENARGRAKGSRTLRQRLGDMVKMSPKRQEEVLDEMKDEVDDETIQIMRKALGTGAAAPVTPSPIRKKVRFSSGVMGSVKDSREEDRVDSSAGTFGPVDTIMADAQQAIIEGIGSFSAPSQPFYPTTGSFGAGLLGTSTLEESGTETLQPAPTKSNPALTKTDSSVPTATKQRKSLRIKAKVASETGVALPSDGEETLLDAPTVLPPARKTPSSDAPGSKRASNRWDPTEKTVEEALESFQIPDSCAGSTVTYAEGKAQRQIAKARSGEFHEEEFVVGIRFVVL